jgi:hypothetical protein
LSPSSEKPRLKGPRRVQQQGGILTISSQGVSNSNGNVQIGGALGNPAGSGGGQGNGLSVGTSNAYIGGAGGGPNPLGAASAGATSGGNSSALASLNVESMTNGNAAIESVGQGIGASGGYGIFGPSLAGAIGAANLPEGEDFTFTPGRPTGGGGVGFGVGTGAVDVTLLSNNASNPFGSAAGGGIASGFGFGAGNGAGQNTAGESAGGRGGGTATGVGALNFEVNNFTAGVFSSEGTTTSVGASAAYVGYAPVISANLFDNILNIPAPTPPLAGAGGAN